MPQTFILSDGVQIEMSSRKGNRSGYTGAALSPAWTLDGSKPFVAACGNPKDPAIMSKLRAQYRTAWHGGIYADAREAAYVVARFHQDPVATEQELEAQGGVWKQFPADLYDLPVVCTSQQAHQYLEDNKANKNNTVAITTKKSKLTLESVMAAVGQALKGKVKNVALVRNTIAAQLTTFRSVDDAVALAATLVK